MSCAGSGGHHDFLFNFSVKVVFLELFSWDFSGRRSKLFGGIFLAMCVPFTEFVSAQNGVLCTAITLFG